MDEIVFVGAKRTPFGAFGGAFKDLTATDLAVHASEAALTQSKIDKTRIDHVIFGNVLQTSKDALYLARHVGLRSGLPIPVPAVTVNRLCGSGFEAIVQAAQLLRLGEAKAVLCGGTENMSQAPYVLRQGRFGYRLGHGELEDSLMAGLTDPIPNLPMALTAENLAVEHQISRKECDEFALRSQKLAFEAREKGLFREEIAPVTITSKKQSLQFEVDEHIRPEASLASLEKLKPVFKKDGVVTAGNASGMVDGAAAVVLTTRTFAKQNQLNILGSLVASAVVGCDPRIMGIGPVPATQMVLKKAELSLADLHVIEINEAFAPQTIAVAKSLQISLDKINQNGGAIAIGHPLGASGTRLTSTALYALQRRGGGLGLVTACIGGGQGLALIVRA